MDNLVFCVRSKLAILYEVEKKSREVARIHLAGVIRNFGRNIDSPEYGDTVFHDSLAGVC